MTGKAVNAATRAVDNAVLDGWRVATASGPDAQRMFVAGMTLKHAPTVAAKVDKVHDGRVERQEQAARRERERGEVPVELRVQ